MSDPSLADFIATLPLADRAEVVVCGGGPGGFCAAIAAARAGADTLLIERFNCLGGMATAGLINPFMAWTTEGKVVNAGLFAEIVSRLDAAGGWGRQDRDYAHGAFDQEIMKQVLQDMALTAGVRLRLHSFLVGVTAAGGHVARLGVASKSGLQAIGGDVFVDGTGDADLSAWAGAPFEQGRPQDGLCQPMTLCFRMVGVDEERMLPRPEINALYEAAKARGDLHNPRENVLVFWSTHTGELHFNTTRIVGKQATDVEDLTAAEIEARKQVTELVAFLRAEVAGFENAYLSNSAAVIGVRESRRVLGDYVLTSEDVLSARDFEDGIARASYCVDIHNPAGTGTLIQHVPPGQSYAIPYRCLTPQGFDNLLVAGRPISSDHAAHSSLRVMPIAMNIGQAAGLAAAHAVQRQTAVREVDVRELRAELREQGAVIDAS